MVNSLMLMRMLHCRSNNHAMKRKIRSADNLGEGPSHGNKRIKICVKKQPTEEICRVCLKEGFIPIFSNNTAEKLSQLIYQIGAVEVCSGDPYPKFLCQSCHALLQGAILFRKTAQKSDEHLKQQEKTLVQNKSLKLEPISDNDDVDTHSNSDFVTESDHKNDVNALTCNNCNLMFNSYQDYSEHMQAPNPKHENNTKEKITTKKTCTLCDLQFETYQEYSDHRLSEEHENKKITCNICHNEYTPQYFKRHLRIHQKEAKHICDICGKEFTIQSQFTRHRLTHFYELPIQCTLCPYRGRFPESLKMHMRTHTGEKPYQCDQCSSRFINKSNLNKHMLTHRGGQEFRPHCCEQCGRGFYARRELEMHIKVDHTGIREHVCRICGKAFGYRKQMMKHELRVHKREKLKSGRMPIYLKVESMKQNMDRTVT